MWQAKMLKGDQLYHKARTLENVKKRTEAQKKELASLNKQIHDLYSNAGFQ